MLLWFLSPGYPDMHLRYFDQEVSIRIYSVHSAQPSPIAAWCKKKSSVTKREQKIYAKRRELDK